MGKKVYAIKEGFDFTNNKKVENIIVNTWDECLKYVKGVKGAKYKSFENRMDADKFLSEKGKLLKKGVDAYPMDIMHAYVDGSFNSSTGKFGYALIVVKNDVILYIENGSAEDASEKSLRQISGELRGAIRAVQYAADHGIKRLVLFHDYEGICCHATGIWECKDKSSLDYNLKINSLMKANDIEVIFVKVDSHTGDIYNEIADEEAKVACGLKTNDVVLKWLKSHEIEVKNSTVSEKLMLVAPNSCNIILEEVSSNTEVKESEVDKKIRELREIKDDEVKLKLAISKLDENIKDDIIKELI